MTDKLICQVLPVKANEIEQARNVVRRYDQTYCDERA